MSPGSSTRSFVDMWFAARGFTVKPDIELGSVDLLVEFAIQGFGAAFVTRSFVAQELSRGKLFELRLGEADAFPPRGIGFAVRRGTKLSLAAERFADALLM
jgi:DNA-binding transcriptional LysR family regulator